MTTATAVEVKERPIIFSGPMVRAILEGRKTQTRRVIKDSPLDMVRFIGRDNLPTGEFGWCRHERVISKHLRCPYGWIGDRLWVRESFGVFGVSTSGVHLGYKARLPEGKTLADTDGGLDIRKADEDATRWAYHSLDSERWKPGIHMPRWASRITLEITEIRVERLQKISGFDARAEGYPEDMPDHTLMHDGGGKKTRQWFRQGWNSINAKRGFSWEQNPWVWVIAFRKIG